MSTDDQKVQVRLQGMNILDHKYDKFRTWLDSISDKRGINSTLTVGQIYEMLDFLDASEEKIDDIILAAFDEKEDKHLGHCFVGNKCHTCGEV